VAVLEAYASGLPIVCFKVPGLERQIIDGVTGVFAKERTADAFFNAIVELDMIRTQAANNCLIEAKKYDSKYIAQCIFTEIDSLLMKV
ncbi:MAG: glycosyltransferase family 4 protein, partial [Sedimentibacter sp.]